MTVVPERLKATPNRELTVSESQALPTTELYVAGRRNDFLEWGDVVASLNPAETAAIELRRLESVRTPSAKDRIRLPESTTNEEGTYEVVLHTLGLPDPGYVLTAFEEFSLSVEADADLNRVLRAGGLCYLPVTTTRQNVNRLAEFSFLRVVRQVPHIRALHPIERSLGKASTSTSPLPDEDAVDPNLVAAVFDGGLVDHSVLSRWVDLYESDDLSGRQKGFDEHGTKVASAVLFGSLVPGSSAARPFGRVDVHRVLDDKSGVDVELYDVLQRIGRVLERGEYEFVNLSLGPAGPIEDDEIHTWTAVLDQHLASGDVLVSVAVGNDGRLDHASGNARIQVPSDAVNLLSVGAADSSRAGWTRADYSCIGPGRRPGVVKPDVLTFGGCTKEPFFAYADSTTNPIPTQGTSFASPSALRLAMGIRAHFGKQLSALALKALLIHTAESHEDGHTLTGWGRCRDDIVPLVTCPENSVRVVYQGSLVPSQTLRVPIPLPAQQIKGNATITATICYTTLTDPQDPGNYTRAGLDVTFRPHSGKFNQTGTIAKSRPFFKREDYASENDLRAHGHKWETVLHRTQSLRGSSLLQPAFDIHYVPREGGGIASTPDPVRYAIVVTVTNNGHVDLYSEVVNEYATILEPIRPIIEIPVTVQ